MGKDRSTLKYEIDMRGKIEAADPNSRPERGVNFEITSLRLNGKAWWTLGLEAFGPEEGIAKALELAVRAVAADADCPKLGSKDSLSYPAWLSRAVKQQ